MMQLNQTPPQTEAQPTPGDVKAQGIRLLDIGVFGPMMVLSAMNKKPPGWLKLAMVGIGVGTILYNAKNFLAVKKELQPPPG